ncbi:proton-conducting transporter membrane subunit [Ancylobacter dichloromethanicus]
MAYSSIEHMGVIALGFGFGGPLGIAGALYHMLNHSLNKSAMFFGAGSVMRAYDTKRIPSIRHVMSRLPVLGGLWLAGAVAITGAPPFALFLSELTIIRAGLASEQYFLIALMAVLLVVIFVGFLNHFRTMYIENGEIADQKIVPVSAWCLLPMWLALVPLFVMGLWWPNALWEHFQTIAHALDAAAPTEALR